MKKVIVKSVTITLILVLLLSTIISVVLCLFFPKTISNLSFKVGNYDLAVTYSEKSYEKDPSVENLVLLICVFSFSSCDKDVDLTVYVSQVRHNIYIGENDDYKIVVYEEKRENPYVADAFIGSLENFVIIKIESKFESVDGVSASFCIDGKEYKGRRDLLYHRRQLYLNLRTKPPDRDRKA